MMLVCCRAVGKARILMLLPGEPMLNGEPAL